MIDKIQYYLVIFFAKFLMLLPKKLRRGFFKFLALLTYLFYSKNKKVIEANLRYVYDDLSEKKIKEIQKACYKKLFLTILSIIENEHLSKDDIKSMVIFENKEYLDNIQKPFIFITAHLGNLDTLGVIVGEFFGRTVHVQQKVKNPFIYNYMSKQREKYGITFVEKHGAVKHLVKAIKNGEVISLVIDQNIKKSLATPVKFLGKETYQLVTSSQLSKKFNIPILPIFIVGEDDNYKVILKKPIYPENKSIEELNQIQADVMSEVINKYPHEWFWCHKRFKNSAPQIYK